MSILGTFNGANIVALPSSPGLRSIQLNMTDEVSIVTSPYTGQTQAQQWPGADQWSGTVTLPPLVQTDADAWISFLAELRGMANCFLLGDPMKSAPAGNGSIYAPVTCSSAPSWSGGYSSGVAYSYGDYVGYNGTFYAYITAYSASGNYTPSTSPGQWTPILTYSSAVPYSAGQVVFFANQFFIYIAPYTGSGNFTPTTSPGEWSPFPGTLNAAASTVLWTANWAINETGLLLPGDYIQVGYRLYRVLDVVSSDPYGVAQITVWPSLREAPAQGTAVTMINPRGLFRLASNKRTWSSDYTRLTALSFQVQEFR